MQKRKNDSIDAQHSLMADFGRAFQQPGFGKLYGRFALVWTFGIFIAFFFFLSDESAWFFPLMCVVALLGYGGVALAGVMYWRSRVLGVMDYPTVSLSLYTLRRGDELEARYEQHFKKDITLKTLKVQLVQQEWVRYTQGTNTYTDTRDIVVDEMWYDDLSVHAGQTLEKRIKLRVPESAMHSWGADNNRISWRVKLSVDLPGWADYHEDFEVEVLAEQGA